MPRATPTLRLLATILLLVGIPSLSGCEHTVSLGYGPVITDAHAPPASKGTIAVALLRDGREAGYRDKQIGREHRSEGIPYDAVFAEQDPVVWVSEGFVRALAGAGFTVERVESAATAGDLATVGGAVREVYVRTFGGGAGVVRVDVGVDQNGAQLASASCQGGSGIYVWGDVGTGFRNTLTAALDDMMTSCLPQIVPILEARAVR